MKWIFGILVMVLISCGKKEPVQIVGLSENSELTFRTDSLIQESCVGENCAKLRLVWPVAEGDRRSGQINKVVEEQLIFLMQYGEDVSVSLDSMVRDYFTSFQSFKAEFPDSYGGWEIDAEGVVSYQSDNTISIYFTQFNYLGGAHPNSLVTFLNFDSRTGEFLSTDRLILDEVKLVNLAEQKFRAYHEVEEGKSLVDDGRFFLPETGFFLANAMGFRDGKFLIVYVPYEIAPYVMGYTELEFSREELGDVVRW